ncbi:MAG: PQQ-binding-like beta-propeller repeat protein [Gammaproteobacteria bacterium]
MIATLRRTAILAPLMLAAAAGIARAQTPAEEVDWPAYGGAPGAANYSALSDINTANVTQLRLAWQWQTGEAPLKEFGTSPGMFETTPIVIDGVMYLSTPYNRIVALDPATGKEFWSYDPRPYAEGQVANGTGFVHRGVAAWRDPRTHELRIVFASRNRLYELDARSGKALAGFGRNGIVNLLEGLQWPVNPKHFTNTSPPIVYRNLIIVGNGVADRLIYRRDPPGDVRAYDARSGQRVWSFHTVPRDGEFGASTWDKHSNRLTGHTNVWAPMSIDSRRGLLFLPVSTPSNDFYGGNRPGDNLYADSIVCLDANTGKRRWYRQLVHHGLWDYDTPAAPSLVKIVQSGKSIDAVVQLTKQGFLFGFDRVSGMPLWPIEERAAPASEVPGELVSPTQPAPVGPPILAPQGVTLDDATDLTAELHAEAVAVLQRLRIGPLFTPPSMQGTLIRPGLLGGADWGGGAFDPDTGILYVKVNNDPALVYPDITDAQGNVPEVGPNDTGDESVLLHHRIPLLKPPYAYLEAVDLNATQMRWQVPFGDNESVRNDVALKDAQLPAALGAVGSAGAIVTRGGLVFVGGGDAVFHAVDKRSGADLWRYSTGGAKTNGTPMTYRVGGRQFVIIAVGGPGPGAVLLAFALGAQSDGAAPSAVALPEGHGGALVEQACSQCHSLDTLIRKRLNRKQWEAQIDAMVARGAKLSDAQFEEIAAYLAAHFGVEPGD